MGHVGCEGHTTRGAGETETGARTARPVLIAALTLFLALAASAPVYASTIVVTLKLQAGGLTVVAPQATAAPGKTVQIPLTIADGRGTGAGWTLRLVGAKRVSITSITARCAPGSTCTLPRTAGTAGGNAILRVAPNSGMGVMNLVVTVAPLASGAAKVPLAFTVS